MQSNEEIVKFLGEGAYGFVNLVKYTKRDGSSFHAAVKNSYAEDFENLQKELQILCQLRGCPRIVECFGDYLEEGFSSYGNKVYKLLLEYASEGSLRSFMDNYSDRKLPEPMIRDFTRMILEGLVCIHGHGYVHCDLKPDNLLVFPSRDSSSYELKISDFGNSLEVGEIPHYWGFDLPFLGTPIYMPPESLIDGVAEKTLDLWSLGCLVLEMYTGEIPWLGLDIDDLASRLLYDEAPEIPECVPCDAREFIEKCFSRKPEERGSASELLSHRFLRREEEEKMEKVIAVVEERRNSFLLKLKLRIRGASKKSADVSEKKPLKLKIVPSKAPYFKKVLTKILRLKTMDSYLVCV
ncbi:hypothetical protein EUTSA_v10027196mg [Eutrema salsugineum]|uniref:Protein kinase domain-containing protein n=1 Tax=Eutrema salsugineum TaxID=72664 RepID=V4P970_EUTSA|nr:mitogen-activated protein kinase kinase kinase 17 [Eutrema salsugineum]ESQ56206.1 hypothetical protein EUTSA_v10027196mg [Eutrema salsugineum]